MFHFDLSTLLLAGGVAAACFFVIYGFPWKPGSPSPATGTLLDPEAKNREEYNPLRRLYQEEVLAAVPNPEQCLLAMKVLRSRLVSMQIPEAKIDEMVNPIVLTIFSKGS